MLSEKKKKKQKKTLLSFSKRRVDSQSFYAGMSVVVVVGMNGFEQNCESTDPGWWWWWYCCAGGAGGAGGGAVATRVLPGPTPVAAATATLPPHIGTHRTMEVRGQLGRSSLFQTAADGQQTCRGVGLHAIGQHTA